MNKVLFYLDQEAHEPLFLAVYNQDWEKALGKLSGDGAETQLINALGELGFTVFSKEAADADAEDTDDEGDGE
jgi:hypothetical protein